MPGARSLRARSNKAHFNGVGRAPNLHQLHAFGEQADDPVVKRNLLELTSDCEEVANNIEDHLTGG
jgi:hypothetical protein